MKTRLALSLASLACLSATRVPLPTPVAIAAATSTPIAGDYVEARTASVFAGACHYNAERVTTGHEAVMAWHVTSGRWKGTDLAGVRAASAVSCDDSLAEASAARRFELIVDGTPAQAAACADWLHAKCGDQFGSLSSVRRGPVTFQKEGRAYHAGTEGFAQLDVQPMPNDACCSQPSLVWYAPLVPLAHRKVGYTENASYIAGTVGDPWQRADENDAFYGTFSL